jgi:protein-disulfide isomerase
MDKRAWIIFSVAVVAILAGLVAFSKQGTIDVSKFNHADPITKADESDTKITDHIYGKKDSKVVLIEYGDFQCPGCYNLHKSLQPVTEVYKSKIAFIFRNFPITSAHPNARSAAAAAEAAGLQGKYWEMNNYLFNNQKNWSALSVTERDSRFNDYATMLKLDVNKFKEDFASEKVGQKINFDQALGKQNGVSATPTLYLNGKQLETSAYESMDALRKTLDTAISEAEKSDKK